MKRTFEKLFSALIAAAFILVCALPALALPAAGGIRTVPEGYNEYDYQKCLAFLETEDENGVKNGEKLSENYDPLDPATWGTHEEFDLDVFYTEPTSTWAELDGELRLRQFRTSQWDGDDLVGTLDFSGCTALWGLVCSGNRLDGVDVSGCDSLSELVCCRDGLTELDVSGLANLWRLYCACNPLFDIDVSNNAYLSQLDCSDIGLTELDLSANPRLSHLYCSDNELAHLDLTANPNMWDLVCENNPMKLIEMGPAGTIRALGDGTVGFYTETDFPLSDVWYYLLSEPDEGAEFLGWYDGNGELLSCEPIIEANYAVTEFVARYSGWDYVSVPDGDVDIDGGTTVADAIIVLRAAMGLLELTDGQLSHADMDQSGDVTVTDAIIVMRIAMGLL